MLRQVRLAVVHLHVPVDEQRRDGVGGRADPLPRQLLAPGADRVLAAGQLAELAPQGVGRATAVESQQAPPFAGLLVEQALGVADARQQQESLQQQDRALAVVARHGAQPAALAQPAGLQQGGHGRQDAASGDGLDRLETRRRGAQPAGTFRRDPQGDCVVPHGAAATAAAHHSGGAGLPAKRVSIMAGEFQSQS